MALQYFLDLGQRLLTEIRRAQQFDFRALHEVADVMDVLGLEAIRAAHRELEFIDRPQQDRIELHLGGLGNRLVFPLQIDEHRQLVLEDAAGPTDGLFRLDRAVGLDVDDELVEVSALLDAGRFDRVGHATHWAEGRIEQQAADGTALLLECHALHRRPVAAAALDFKQHVELTRLGQIGNDELGVYHLDVVIGLNIARGDRSRALLVQAQLGAVARVPAERHGLEVQQHIDHVFLYTLEAGVLVQHAVDLDFGDGSTRHGGEQHAPQSVAQRMAESALEGLDHHARLTRGHRLHLDDAGLQEFRY